MSAGNPLFSVLTPVFNPPEYALRAAIESVRMQTWADWELILVDDLSTSAAVRRVLSEAALSDRRITVVFRESNGGIIEASADALEHASGEFVALLDHDDLLAESALELMAEAIARRPSVDYLYSDEDKVNAAGEHFSVFRKPTWSPERLRSQMYTAHLSVMRTSLVREVGGFRAGFEGSQDHDLALRVTERARQVVHVPHVLYHWRTVPGSTAENEEAKPYARESGRRAVQEHIDRVGISGTVELGDIPGTYRVIRDLPADRSVSVIIPTRGGSGLVWGVDRCFVVEAVRSALAHTDHENVEFVVVYDRATPAEVMAELRAIAGDKLVPVLFEGPFNFSRKCNVGVLASRGDVVVMLNDDVEVVSDRWLETLVAPLSEPDVGLSGAKLLYADGTMQHAGHLYHQGGWTHIMLGEPKDSREEFFALHISRECSGVTAACSALRREVYDEVGGFNETLPGNFNDVDFCHKILHQGYRTVWMADCALYHFESRTREPQVKAWEIQLVQDRWGTQQVDPYFPQYT